MSRSRRSRGWKKGRVASAVGLGWRGGLGNEAELAGVKARWVEGPALANHQLTAASEARLFQNAGISTDNLRRAIAWAFCSLDRHRFASTPNVDGIAVPLSTIKPAACRGRLTPSPGTGADVTSASLPAASDPSLAC